MEYYYWEGKHLEGVLKVDRISNKAEPEGLAGEVYYYNRENNVYGYTRLLITVDQIKADSDEFEWEQWRRIVEQFQSGVKN